MMYPSTNMVTRADLADYAPPTLDDIRKHRKSDKAGSRWKPIPHLELIEEIETASKARGLVIAEEQFCTSDDGHDIYGFLRFDPSSAPSMPDVPGAGGITPELGFRHSNMQRMRLFGVHGERVGICSNGMIVGDFLFGCKTTRGNVEKLHVPIAEGMETWERQAADAKRLIEFLAGEEITNDRADQLLMEGMRRNVYAANQLGKIDAKYRAYIDSADPHHEAFAPRNLWSLYNAVTEVGKSWSVRNVEKGLKGFPRVVADAYGFELTQLVEDAPTGASHLDFTPNPN